MAGRHVPGRGTACETPTCSFATEAAWSLKGKVAAAERSPQGKKRKERKKSKAAAFVAMKVEESGLSEEELARRQQVRLRDRLRLRVRLLRRARMRVRAGLPYPSP
jgi:hypothetical protein